MGGPTYMQEPPAYLQATHWEMLTGEMHDVEFDTAWEMSAAATGNNPLNLQAVLYNSFLNGSPYAGANAVDPSDDLDIIEEALGDFTDSIAAFDPETVWEGAATAVGAAADTLFTDDSVVADAVAAEAAATLPVFQQQLLDDYLRLYAGNSSESSVYTLASALRTMGRNNDLAKFAADFVAQQHTHRAAFINQQTNVLASMHTAKEQAKQNVYAAKSEFYTRRIVAMKEFTQEELEYALQDATWDINLFKEGSSVVGAINGAPSLGLGPSKQQTALSTVLGLGSILVPFIPMLF